MASGGRLDHDGVVGGELAVQQALGAQRGAGRAQVVRAAELAVVVRRRQQVVVRRCSGTHYIKSIQDILLYGSHLSFL